MQLCFYYVSLYVLVSFFLYVTKLILSSKEKQHDKHNRRKDDYEDRDNQAADNRDNDDHTMNIVKLGALNNKFDDEIQRKDKHDYRRNKIQQDAKSLDERVTQDFL